MLEVCSKCASRARKQGLGEADQWLSAGFDPLETLQDADLNVKIKEAGCFDHCRPDGTLNEGRMAGKWGPNARLEPWPQAIQ